MFTLIRPIAAVLMAIFGYFAAQAYEPHYNPQANLGQFPVLVAVISAFVGYLFLGGRLGRALWFSIFITFQTIVLAAVCTAFFLGIKEVFARGFRRQYAEVMDAFAGLFGIMVDWLGRGLVQEFIIFLIIGSTIVGTVLHVTRAILEGRRNDR